jgi:hypothetical protein
MTGFSADWLALRGSFDQAARDPGFEAPFLAALPPGALIVDLGAGAGSNIAALRAHPDAVGRGFRWRHVDDDPALLAVAQARFAADPAIGFARCDLATEAGLAAALDGAAAVTCAALVDLVSAAWIARLAAVLAARRLSLLALLTYDGRMDWAPPDAADAVVAAAFHRDMTRDKGFGPALGPAAATALATALAARGARLAQRRSDWRIAAADMAMRAAMVEGIAAAATAAAPEAEAAIAAWRMRRATATRLVIGHADLRAAWPD